MAFELPINQILTGDCLKIMKEWPDRCVDLIVTDPPYGVGYTGGHFHSGDVNIKRERERLAGDDRNVYREVLPEFYRILSDNNGGAYVFFAEPSAKNASSRSSYHYDPHRTL